MLATILRAVGNFLAALFVLVSQREQGRSDEHSKQVENTLKKMVETEAINSSAMSVDDAISILRDKANNS